LGTTSYILPADLLTNIEALAPRVDDIEIVLFESDEMSNLPDEETIRKLKSIAAATNLTYTVHLPLDINLGSLIESERRRSVEKCLRIISLVSPLGSMPFIVHFHPAGGPGTGDIPPAGWVSSLTKSTRELLASGIEPDRLCVENLDYRYELVEEIVVHHGLSVCLDVGHMLLYNHPIEEFIDLHLHRIRVVHLHGLKDGVDHKDITDIPPDCLDMLMERLTSDSGRPRVVTLEVFTPDDLKLSMAHLERFLT
jgi:sugar phosphate isomerase/epimerase